MKTCFGCSLFNGNAKPKRSGKYALILPRNDRIKKESVFILKYCKPFDVPFDLWPISFQLRISYYIDRALPRRFRGILVWLGRARGRGSNRWPTNGRTLVESPIEVVNKPAQWHSFKTYYVIGETKRNKNLTELKCHICFSEWKKHCHISCFSTNLKTIVFSRHHT